MAGVLFIGQLGTLAVSGAERHRTVPFKESNRNVRRQYRETKDVFFKASNPWKLPRNFHFQQSILRIS